MEQTVFTAEPRTDFGTRAAKVLRSQGRVPANLYGHKEGNLLVSFDAKEFSRFLEAGHRILTVRVGDKEQRSVVREVQHDAFGIELLHVDLTRVSRDERIEMEVPVETIGTPKGVASGGVLEFPLNDLLVSGLPDDIPEHIELNIEDLETGQNIRIKEVTPPPGCKFVQDGELVVLHIVAPKGEVEAPPAETEAAEPEVISKAKDTEEAAGGEKAKE